MRCRSCKHGGPLEGIPGRQVVITSGSQLHLASAWLPRPLCVGVNSADNRGATQPSLKPQHDITDPLSESEATDIYCIATAI